MMGAEICKEIFGGSELTITFNNNDHMTESSAILNKWHPTKKSIVVPVEVAKYLINTNILELDSGNFETGEEHYIYNRNTVIGIHNNIFEMLLPILREVRINKLLNNA